VTPVPGSTVRLEGTNALFRIWIVVTTLPEGEVVLVAVGIADVTTVVNTVVGRGVETLVVVTTIVGMVVGMVVGTVVAGCWTAGWVHPMNAIKAIRRINKPMNFFMKSK
jgi:hypothetical protein